MNIDQMCDIINTQLNKKLRDPGSIAHVKSASENSIVRFDNEYGAYTQLTYGSDETLKSFLGGVKQNLDKKDLNATEDLLTALDLLKEATEEWIQTQKIQ